MKAKASGLTDKEKNLSIIKDNPEGITLPEIAYIMEVASISISREIKKLLKKDRIKKKRNKYLSG